MVNRLRSRLALSALCLACTACGVALGVGLRRADAATDPSRFAKLELFAKAVATLEQYYVEPLDGEVLVRGAIRGMAHELDPHTEYLEASEAKLLREEIEGVFGGVGLVVGIAREEGGGRVLEVRDVIATGPAAAAGVRMGDHIVAIEGRPLASFKNLRDAIIEMRGKPGSEVRFTIQREGATERLELQVTRAIIDPEGVEVRDLGGGMAVLRLRDFPQGVAAEARAAIKKLRGEHGALGGVILDLRDNGGGLLDEAVQLVDLFVSGGPIVRTRGRQGRVLDEARATALGTERKLAVTVLVNKGTASAAEITAGALQDIGRATIVGERTYGKGSVQAPFELGDGSLLKVTIALYYTPKDRLIQAEGIAPDIIVGAVEQEALEADSRPEMDTERDAPGHLQPAKFAAPDSAKDPLPAILADVGADTQLRVAVRQLAADMRRGAQG